MYSLIHGTETRVSLSKTAQALKEDACSKDRFKSPRRCALFVERDFGREDDSRPLHAIAI
jgi:hypothetical protein